MNPEAVIVEAPTRFVNVSEVLDFVDRTISHGAPERVALRRAAKRYGVELGLIKSFLRGAQ